MDRVGQWIDQIVIGLSFCPFAARPWRAGTVRIMVSHAETRDELNAELIAELQLLDGSALKEEVASTPETSLVVTPKLLQEFWDYSDYAASVSRMMRKKGWEGVFQLATFHPDYCFADAATEDPVNLTNRSPYPIFHFLRESSITSALETYQDPASIPEKNTQRIQLMSDSERSSLFSYLAR